MDSRKRSSAGPAILVAFALIGGIFAVSFLYRPKQGGDSLTENGFNLNHIDSEPQKTPAPGDVAAPSRSQRSDDSGPSGLNMIRGTHDEPRSGPAGRAADNASASQALTDAIRANESRYANLAMAYTKKYPVIRDYGRDWMRYPDLHRYNDEYFRDHDPIRFAWNVARSPNFAALIIKYAGRPEMISFVTDVVRTAPAGLAASARNYLEQDGNAMNLLNRFASSLGLPNGLVPGLAGGNVSPQQAAASVVRSNPQIQNLLQQGNVDPGQLNSSFQQPKNLPQLGGQ